MQGGYNPFSHEPISTKKGIISKITHTPSYFTHRSKTEQIWGGKAFAIDLNEIDIMRENNVKEVRIKLHMVDKNILYKIDLREIIDFPTRNKDGTTEKIIMIKDMKKYGEENLNGKSE